MAVDGTVDSGLVADQAAADAAQREELQEQVPEAAPAFDAGKVDLENPDALAVLTDDQLNKVEQHNAEHPAPVTEAEKLAAADTATKTAEAAAAEKATADATKYAGKYATPEALSTGVLEIAKKLGYDEKAFKFMLETVSESGGTKSIETLYAKLEKQLGEKGAAPAASQGDSAQGSGQPGTPSGATQFNPADPQVKNAVDQLTNSQLAQSSLAHRMAAKGLELPKDMTEFDQLAEVNPYFAMEFKQAYQELYRANEAQAQGFYEAQRTVVGANAGVVDADEKAIRAMATEQGFKLTDAEIASVKAAAIASPFNYEDKFGHRFLRPNAVRDHFLVHDFPGKAKEIALNKQTEGRQQAISDLEKAGKRETRGLGTSKLGSRLRAVQTMPDLNDPDVIAGLPDAALSDPEGYFLKQGFVKRT